MATSSGSMDRAVLARLTGDLGDAKTVSRICADIGGIYTSLLADTLGGELNLELDVEYIGSESALMSTLVGRLNGASTLTIGSLRNWCPNFILSCENILPISIIANLLGDDTGAEGESRRLSAIELDIASLVFQKIASVLRSGIEAPGGFEPALIDAYDHSEHVQKHAEIVDMFAAAVRMRMTIGKISGEIQLIIPQGVLLKTVIVQPKLLGQQGEAREAWKEQLEKQVRRSQVELQARVRMQSLTLETISRLAVGDVIPFFDAGTDVRVEVDANGKMLYNCEFGRSGQNYTVKIKESAGTSEESLKRILEG